MSGEVGFVRNVRGPVAYLDGLPDISVGEMVSSASGARGFVGSLHDDVAEVFLLSDQAVSPGEMFTRTGELLDIPVGDFLLGRSINPVGDPVDGKGKLAIGKNAVRMSLDEPAVGIAGRRFISEQFDTGIGVIDTIFPIGKGQRELIIGEQRSGKTQFLLDIIANLRGSGMICVYAIIGKPVVETRDIWLQLTENKLLDNTVLVMSIAADPAPLTFLAPQTAMTVAQYFQRQGKDVLIILDDMGVAARNYREMALVSNRPPGRESYPGDIFYQQARLLERAGCFNPTAGSGSITALPVVELVLAEFSAFIPTNLMGMTDGHILFKAALSQQGTRPAVDRFLSVTRVGSQTQQRLQNALAMRLKETLARGAQLEVVSRFGSELPAETRAALLARQQVEELLNQKPFVKISKEVQTVMFALPFSSFLKGKTAAFVKDIKPKLLAAFTTDPQLIEFAKQVFTKKDLAELFAAVETIVPVLSKYVSNQPN
ncbi:F0F1 ATP synthase subunit alpha [Candidatus Microgenomates bacterium]|nr:F0F1 ATP synthase subunit alpha [Candidatus Microgenomates bacterium]